MFLFRSLTIGLLGACVLLLIGMRSRPVPTRVAYLAPPAAARVWQPPTAGATIVDIAAGVRGGDVSSLIHLAADEHVVAVGDRGVASDLDAGMAIAEHPPIAGGFLDLDVADTAGAHRRVLVLMH